MAEIIPLQPRNGGPCATVFGYLPYWSKNTTVRYDLLTHLACFSVGANADGSLSNAIGWPWTSVINAAHQNGVKVILTVTQFDPDTTLTLITTPAAKTAFFANVEALMLAGQADGVNIDFEGSGTYQSYINAFMADLTSYLHAQIPGCEVTFAGPSVNWGDRWDLGGLAASCDGIFIMGYAFYGDWSSTSGPNAPLTGGSINITDTVYDEYAEVQQTCPEKLILGVPYYGYHWITATGSARSTVVEAVGSVNFSIAQSEAESYGLLWDSVSQTPWYRYQSGTEWHQVWFDNADSLRLKYQLAKDAGLQGVGMWCLGKDAGRDELWDLLEEEFIVDCRDPLAAVLLDQDAPTNMEAGSTATVWVEFQNTGYETWQNGEVRLGTWDPQDRSSVFYTAGDWLNAQRPAEMDATSCVRDGTARFTFTLTAPQATGDYTESWRLLKEGEAWFGPTDVTFQITVIPRPIPGDFDDDRDVDMEDFGRFQACRLGSQVPQTDTACADADLNDDTFVDDGDMALLRSCLTAANVEGDPDCIP